MNKKDTQRKTLAMLVLFFIAYIYVEKVLTPYIQPPLPEKTPYSQGDSTGLVPPPSMQQVNIPVPQNQGTFPGATDSQQAAIPALTETTPSAGQELQQAAKAQTPSGAPSDRNIQEAGTFQIENDVLKVSLSTLGGRFQSVQLKDFKRYHPNDSELVELIAHIDGMVYPGGLVYQGGSDAWVNYRAFHIDEQGRKHALENGTVLTPSTSPNTNSAKIKIRFEGELSDGRAVFKELSLAKDSYFFDVSIGFVNPSASEPFYIEWPKFVENKDNKLLDPYDTEGFVWFNGDKSERLQFNEITSASPSRMLDGLLWLGFGNKYFATAFVYNNDLPENTDKKPNGKPLYPTKVQIEKQGNFARTLFSSDNSQTPLSIKVFTGPKSYPMLESAGSELKRLLDLGMTGVISAPLLSFLGLFYKLLGNYGLAIVLLTIAVKFALYPLNASQFKQMKALQALKPELDRIKENIKDRQQQQQALMELYKKKGVNPLGGCLPILIQMPIFIGLYSALMLSVELRHADFGMWVHDLSAPDRLMIGDFGVPVLVLLFTISMMVQQWLTPSAVDPAQKKAMMIMPVIMFFMFMGFPSGLALYWLTNNLFSIGQQQAIQYNDKHGKSGFKITVLVAIGVFVLAYICTLF